MFSVVQIKADTPILNDTVKVLKSRDYLAYKEASKLISDAKAKAKTIIKSAKNSRDAFYQKTKEEALSASEKDFEVLKFENAINTIGYLSSLEIAVTNIVDEAVRQVIDTHEDKDIINGTIRKAFKKLYSDKRITIVSSPESHHLITEDIDQLLSLYPDKEGIEAKVDPGLSGTQLRFETTSGVIHFNLDDELDHAISKIRSLFNS